MNSWTNSHIWNCIGKYSLNHFQYYILISIDTDTSILLQLKDLNVDQWMESCIGFTQENSIEYSVQDCLPYILKGSGLCSW